jgi:hypothetical protein
MPGGNGTGPFGQGPGTGRGGGGGGNRPGAGPGGVCICPNCKLSVPHTAGTPCATVDCPKCGAKMVRG